MSKNLPSLLLAPLLGAATITTLSACGDEVTEVNETTQVTQVTGMLVVKKGEALPECGAENEGTMAYSMDSAAAYYCIDEEWTSLQGKDGKDGKDGEDGKDGKDGKDGEDGTDGEDGKDGSDATSCKMTDNDNGSVTIICGADSSVFYKPLCAGKVYNPDSSFCFVTTIYRKCGGKIYNPDSLYCAGNFLLPLGEPIPRCKNSSYNPDSLFCHKDSLYKLCDGWIYDPDKKFCVNDREFDQCGVGIYDQSLQFCENGELKNGNAICEFIAYDSTDAFCDTRDTTVYKYVVLEGSGYSETWMAEDLHYETSGYDPDANFDISWQNHYGGHGIFYTWTTAISVCPEGWHLPSKEEYESLIEAADEATIEKALGSTMEYWTSTEEDDELAYTLYSPYLSNLLCGEKSSVNLVRCVKDK